jgi:uncharacterized membrane protein (DUF4010 family)
LAVGIEREWSGHTVGPGARFAGVRTFLLLGLSGGLAGLLADLGYHALAAVLLAAGGALVVAAYAIVARRGDQEAIDGTTEAAAVAILALGVTAGLGRLGLAAAIGAVIVLALREKGQIHDFVRRIGEVELRAALQFAVLALVILPILPEGPYGPLGGVRPRELWIVVLVVSALNFAGYLARRTIGETRGLMLAGLLGGFISSTAVSLSFARQSRERPFVSNALALGVIAACTVLIPRIMVLTLVLRPSLTMQLAPFLLPPLLVGAAIVAFGMRVPHQEDGGSPQPEGRSPLRLGSAILLAVGFQAVLMAMTFVRDQFGVTGVLWSAALLGLTDMDALSLAMSRLAGESGRLALAATAVAVGVLANSLLKSAIVLSVGAGDFRRRAGFGLLALVAATALGLWLGTR